MQPNLLTTMESRAVAVYTVQCTSAPLFQRLQTPCAAPVALVWLPLLMPRCHTLSLIPYKESMAFFWTNLQPDFLTKMQ